MHLEQEEHMNIERRETIQAEARKLRKQYFRYKEAEIVYSISHKKLLELALFECYKFHFDVRICINLCGYHRCTSDDIISSI